MFADLPMADVARLIRSCQCLVHPHRAEAFCLTIAEAMSCGLPTIVTPWGGNADYCSPDNSLLIPYTLVAGARVSELTWAEPEPSPIVWAQPALEGIQRWMRWAFDHPDRAALVGERAARTIRDNWSWEQACLRLVRILDERIGIAVDKVANGVE